MGKITTNFEKFRNKKVEKQQKTKEFEPLADDILFFKEDNKLIKVDEPVEVVQVTGVLGEEEAEKLEEKIGLDLKTQIYGDIKRGEVIWLTALLRRKGSANYTTQNSTGIIKCRVVDIYYGLNKLKDIIKKTNKSEK